MMLPVLATGVVNSFRVAFCEGSDVVICYPQFLLLVQFRRFVLLVHSWFNIANYFSSTSILCPKSVYNRTLILISISSSIRGPINGYLMVILILKLLCGSETDQSQVAYPSSLLVIREFLFAEGNARDTCQCSVYFTVHMITRDTSPIW